MNSAPFRYAAIDIGSNTFHLLIAELTRDKGLKIIRDIQRPTRLSASLQQKGGLESEAINRSLKTLEEFCDICRRLEAKEVRAVGTSALRRAANASQFLQQAKQKCQLEVEVISGFQEAELVLKAVFYNYSLREGRSLIADIGGGSTEFIFIKEGKVEEVKSLSLGSVDLTEQFFPGDKATKAQCSALGKVVKQKLKLLPAMDVSPKMISLGGTATCLGSLALGLRQYSAEKVDGITLDIEKIADIIEILQGLSVTERIHRLGLQPLRADIILAGAIIQQKIMEKYGIKSCQISAKGVRYGLLLKMLEENGITITKHHFSII